MLRDSHGMPSVRCAALHNCSGPRPARPHWQRCRDFRPTRRNTTHARECCARRGVHAAVAGCNTHPAKWRPCLALYTAAPAIGEAEPEAGGGIDVVFLDTRWPPPIAAMQHTAAAVARLTTTTTRFHAVLREEVAIAGWRVHPLRLPPHAECIFNGLSALATGPGRAYLYKPLLHWVLPASLRRVIVLDTDVAVVRDLRALWSAFASFGGAVVGVANEQSIMYQRVSDWQLVGKNGGVQLLHLARMRSSLAYASALERVASARGGRRIGYLGDQTLYTFLAAEEPRLVHRLGCEWNRQLSPGRTSFANASLHACPARCGILHANFGALKCVARLMQESPSCAAWGALVDQAGRPNATCPAPALWAHFKRRAFQRAIREHFADCCVGDPSAGPRGASAG